jgi:hypothetical protein
MPARFSQPRSRKVVYAHTRRLIALNANAYSGKNRAAIARNRPSSLLYRSIVILAPHYPSLARRILDALSDGARFVLITDDPPANSQILSMALRNVAGPGRVVIGITCVPGLTSDDLKRVRTQRRDGEPQYSLPSSPLFVFDNFDRLSDKQIEDVYESMLHGDQTDAAGVLLAKPDLLERLEEPALRFLKKGLAARFGVRDVLDAEGIAFLHDELLKQRDRQSEARGFRRGILISLASCGLVLAVTTGAFLLLSPAERPSEESPSIAKNSSGSDETSWLRPTVSEATSAAAPQVALGPDPASTFRTTPPTPSTQAPPPINTEDAAHVAASTRAQPPAGLPLSATEIAALLGRGDAFLRAGDILSARLFYERAATAGDELAALKLRATFDPAFVAGRGTGSIEADPSHAMTPRSPTWGRPSGLSGSREALAEPSSIADRLSGAQPAATATMPTPAISDEQRDQMFWDFEIQRHHERTNLAPRIRSLKQTKVANGMEFYGATVRPRYDSSVRRAASRSAGVVKAHRGKTTAQLNRGELARLLTGGQVSGRAPLR